MKSRLPGHSKTGFHSIWLLLPKVEREKWTGRPGHSNFRRAPPFSQREGSVFQISKWWPEVAGTVKIKHSWEFSLTFWPLEMCWSSFGNLTIVVVFDSLCFSTRLVSCKIPPTLPAVTLHVRERFSINNYSSNLSGIKLSSLLGLLLFRVISYSFSHTFLL